MKEVVKGKKGTTFILTGGKKGVKIVKDLLEEGLLEESIIERKKSDDEKRTRVRGAR